MKYGVYRIIGSGAAVHSVSRYLLATLESFEQRVKLFVSSTKKEEKYLCGPRLLSTFDPEGDTFRRVRDNLTDVQLEAADDTFRCVRDNLTDVQLEAADGSGALMIGKTIRLSVGPKCQPRKVFVC